MVKSKRDIETAYTSSGLIILNAAATYELLGPSYSIDSIEIRFEKSHCWKESLVDAFSDLYTINYDAVFIYAIHVLNNLPTGPIIESSLKSLYKTAQYITSKSGLLKQDLSGRIYHSSLGRDIAKSFATYYTSIPAGELLAWLSVKNWNDKVVDFACGSGTLLLSAYHKKMSIAPLQVDIQDINLHKQFIENELWGFDAMPFAAHLTLVNLALQQPSTVFDHSKIYQLPVTSKTRLGSLDFIRSSKINIQHSFKGRKESPKQKGMKDPGKSISIVLPKNGFDVVIMNPPFTKKQRVAKVINTKELKRVVKDLGIGYTSSGGLALPFVLLGDKYLSPNGRLSLILPTAILGRKTWKGIRNLLIDNYVLEHIIISWIQSNPSFSEDTELREIMLVAKKNGDLLFHRDNIINVAEFILKLRDSSDSLSKYIRSKEYFFKNSHSLLIDFDHSQIPPETLVADLLAILNTLLEDRNLRNNFNLSDINLPNGIKHQIHTNKHGRRLLRFNKLLLTSAYSEYINFNIENDKDTRFTLVTHIDKAFKFMDSREMAEVMESALDNPINISINSPIHNPIFCNGKVVGESISFPKSLVERLSSNLYRLVAFRNSKILRSSLIQDGILPDNSPPYGIDFSHYLTNLNNIADVGLFVKQVSSAGFKVADKQMTGSIRYLDGSGYSKLELNEKDNKWLVKDLRKNTKEKFTPGTGTLLVPRKTDLFNSAKVLAIVSYKATASNMWIPVTPKQLLTNDGELYSVVDISKAICIWLHSSFGLLTLLANRGEVRGAWSEWLTEDVRNLNILDPTKLSSTQMDELLDLWSKFSNTSWATLPSQRGTSSERAKLDSSIAKILKIPISELALFQSDLLAEIDRLGNLMR